MMDVAEAVLLSVLLAALTAVFVQHLPHQDFPAVLPGTPMACRKIRGVGFVIIENNGILVLRRRILETVLNDYRSLHAWILGQSHADLIENIKDLKVVIKLPSRVHWEQAKYPV